MSKDEQSTYPPGTQPYDTLNGLRIGALAGGLIGMIPTAIFGAAHAWLILLGVAVGGAIGYAYERRSIERRRDAAE